MTYDLIIIVQSKDEQLVKMTQRCIDSCISEGDVNVILVESGPDTVYDGVDKYLRYEGDFVYNKALNMGLEYAKGDVHILANNDLLFHPGWSAIGDIMKANGHLSASALSSSPYHGVFKRGNYAYEGYMIGYQFTGWCLFAAREVFEKIGKLDETYDFWFSDNAYADQLKRAGIVHALLSCIRVDHIESQTTKKQDAKTQKRLIGEQIIKYRNAQRQII